MSAGSPDTSRARKGSALLALLCLVSSLALGQEVSLDARLEEIRETGRFVPPKAMAALVKIETEARAGSARQRAEFIELLSSAYRGTGNNDKAMVLADELLALGKSSNDKVIIAKGLLSKAYTSFANNELATSHKLAWESEIVANQTNDMATRIRATLSSGESYAEEGNFPAALKKLQLAVKMAHEYGHPVGIVSSLNSLASLYGQMKEYDKGFEALAEAYPYAEKTNSPGRMSTLKDTEYALSMATNQPQRGLRALLAGLEYEKAIGAEAMIAGSLVNLSDSYLKQHDYPRAVDYGTQALAAAKDLNDESTEATAHINIGQALLGMGKLVEGKRSFELGLAWYERGNDKPQMQEVLMEYGSALERAGDMAGAVKVYHRERAISNELFEDRRQKATLELQEKYEAEKRQNQIEVLKRDIVNRNLEQRVFWLLAIVFAMAAVIVGFLYRKVRHANAQLKVKNLELKQQSSRDPLTGLYNRRHFQEFMRTHVQVEKRGAGTSGEEIVGALFLLDIDHFKHVNDTYGHAGGDAVLRMIADSLREILRETDMIVRWGGEEFLAFLPAIPRSGVEEIARRLLAGISNTIVEYQEIDISVDVSIGFAPFPLVPGEHELPWERAVNLVDMALYLAKAHGRNRAYGVRGFNRFEETSMEAIEQDLELAWRAGFVDMSIVLSHGAVHPDSAPLEQRSIA